MSLNESFITIKVKCEIEISRFEIYTKSENLWTPSLHDIPYHATSLPINYIQLD